MGGAFLMMMARMGSLHALEQERGNWFWRRWLKDDVSSADTTGRVFARVDLLDLRSVLGALYIRMKRNKTLGKTAGHAVLILGGPESSSS